MVSACQRQCKLAVLQLHGDRDRCTNVREVLSDSAPDGVNQRAVSLLSRLHAPASSELSRKHKCASNPPSGKCRSCGSNYMYVTEPKSVKPEQRISRISKGAFGCFERCSILSWLQRRALLKKQQCQGRRQELKLGGQNLITIQIIN